MKEKTDKPKLNYRFHNSNSSEYLTRVLLRICIDANMKKVEEIIKEETMMVFKKGENQIENSIEDN